MSKLRKLVPRAKKAARFALPVLVLVAAAALMRSPPAAAPAPVETPIAPAIVEIQPVVMAVDTPPPVAGRGWPFRELPLVLKREQPVPRPALAPVPPPFVRIALAPRPRLFPPEPAPPPPESPSSGPPLWVAAPLAVGVGLGAADVAGTVPGQVIPEPATILLTSTGLALVGAARRRRRGATDPTRDRARRDPPRA